MFAVETRPDGKMRSRKGGRGGCPAPPSPEKHRLPFGQEHSGEVRRHNAHTAKNVTSKLSPGAVPLQPVSASPCSQRIAMVWGRGAVCVFAHLVSRFPCEALRRNNKSGVRPNEVQSRLAICPLGEKVLHLPRSVFWPSPPTSSPVNKEFHLISHEHPKEERPEVSWPGHLATSRARMVG